MCGVEIGYIEGADEYESFVKSLPKYRNLDLFGGLEVVTDELPV